QPQQASTIGAYPQPAIRRGGKSANHFQPRRWLAMPNEPSTALFGVVQSGLRAHPQRSSGIAGDRPDRRAAESLLLIPSLPFVVAQPARQPRPQQPQPYGTFAVLENRGDIVRREALPGAHDLPTV